MFSAKIANVEVISVNCQAEFMFESARTLEDIPDYFYANSIDYTCDYDAVFDLVGDMAALQLMKNTFDFLNSIGKPCTVSGVIEYLKRKTDFGTKYIAVRAKDEKFPEKDDRILFISGDRPYLNLNPRIQLCFFDKSVFNGYEYKIVYPNEYATVVDMTDMTI